jgi:hypothetical protein
LLIAAEHDHTPLAEKRELAPRLGACMIVVHGSRHGTPFDASKATNCGLLAVLTDQPLLAYDRVARDVPTRAHIEFLGIRSRITELLDIEAATSGAESREARYLARARADARAPVWRSPVWERMGQGAPLGLQHGRQRCGRSEEWRCASAHAAQPKQPSTTLCPGLRSARTQLPPVGFLYLYVIVLSGSFYVSECQVALCIGYARDLIKSRERAAHMRGIDQWFLA